MSPTYEILKTSRGLAIRCLECLSLSYHPQDIEHKYCARCRQFHEIVAQQKQMAEDIRQHLERKKGK